MSRPPPIWPCGVSFSQLAWALCRSGISHSRINVWKRWDAAVSDNLNRVQNKDGSWSGHHCITGRTFCTSAALLTLLADRTRFPEHVLAKAVLEGEPK